MKHRTLGLAVRMLCAAGALLWASGSYAKDSCTYKGTTYSHGSAACQSGTQYRCDDGQWKGLGVACAPGDKIQGCQFNGNSYAAGSATCQAGTQFRCEDGAWRSLAIACTSSGDVPVRPRTCLYNAATVASGSSICKSGITFLCEDGEWRDLGTPCQ